MHKLHIEIAFIRFIIILQVLIDSKFKIDYCESTLHTMDHQKDISVQLHCQSNEKYEYCGIGNMTRDKTGVRENCNFSKSNISQSNSPVLTKGHCNKDEFLSQLGYGGILQSDYDCIIRIKLFNSLGKHAIK